MKIVVLDAGTMGFPDEDWKPLTDLGDVQLYEITPYEETQVIERTNGFDVIICNKVPMTETVLRKLPDLKLICLLATGTNNVDLKVARELGIDVCNIPGYSTASVAQHTFALILELTNRVGYYNSRVQEGDWKNSKFFCYWNHQIPDLENKTLGIIGFGEIGRKVGEIATAFGMKIMASMRTPRNPPDWDGFSFATNEEIFAEADVISLHCPQTEENTGFVNRNLLKRCKKEALLINTGRGGLINEAELANSLKDGLIGGAAVDVVASEPMRDDCPLVGIENLIITPHLAWASRESRLKLLGMLLDNITAFKKGKAQNVVNK